jgi:hypothetical protein
MNNVVNTLEDNYENLIHKIQKAFLDIPFGNSAFQTEMFVLSAQITPERMYRQIGLSLLDKLNDFANAKLDIEKLEVQKAQLQNKIDNCDIDQYEKKLAEIELKKINISSFMNNKLLNDVIVEINQLYSHFIKFPSYTRQQFESGEKRYFEQKLQRQIIGINGAKESYINMTDDKNTLDFFEKQISQLSSKELHDMLENISENCLQGKLEFKKTIQN